ncbi:MAG: hypothetical protein QOF01_5131 [Thermomicrobiales bacterium]|nr:hypothetical protein [Thermomicrobiales bacterium]
MDDSRFDQMTKDMASSRRKLLRGLAGVAGGSLLVAKGLGEADAAACRRNGQVCREHANCCSGQCGKPDATGRRRCFSSCFVAGTRVAMADGTSRAIERVEVGEHVLGQHGRTNRVVEVERPMLGSRLLYALNDSSFFVTAEHPFMTETGWKAIDPAATAVENPTLSVGRLKVGDRLLVLAGVALPIAVPAGMGGHWSDERFEVRLESTRLLSLVGRPDHPATPLFNLLLDGDHAYFANEMLVHNKG